MGVRTNISNEETALVFGMGRSGLAAERESDCVTVLGLGNVLLSDEGVGVHAAHELHKRFTFSPLIEIIDGGTMGLDLLPVFQDRNRILILDAADFGKRPGYISQLKDDSIPAILNSKLSVHHIGLADLLAAAKLIRKTGQEVLLIGIQPESLEIGLELSDNIANRLDDVLELAIQKLSEWNIIATPKTPERADISAIASSPSDRLQF